MHGNLVLKKAAYGTLVNFKVFLPFTLWLPKHAALLTACCSAQGFKDANHLMDLLGTIFCPKALAQAAADAAEAECSYDNLFTVHIAILTASLGKKLFVQQGSLLCCVLQSLFLEPATKKRRRKRSVAVEFAERLDDQCNTEIFSIHDWEAVYKKCTHCDARSNVIPASSADVLHMTASDLQELSSWNNTITVTAKGAVILRFSWEKPIRWTGSHAALALRASKLACALIENCC